jgi:hypothetical protein
VSKQQGYSRIPDATFSGKKKTLAGEQWLPKYDEWQKKREDIGEV